MMKTTLTLSLVLSGLLAAAELGPRVMPLADGSRLVQMAVSSLAGQPRECRITIADGEAAEVLTLARAVADQPVPVLVAFNQAPAPGQALVEIGRGDVVLGPAEVRLWIPDSETEFANGLAVLKVRDLRAKTVQMTIEASQDLSSWQPVAAASVPAVGTNQFVRVRADR